MVKKFLKYMLKDQVFNVPFALIGGSITAYLFSLIFHSIAEPHANYNPFLHYGIIIGMGYLGINISSVINFKKKNKLEKKID